MTKYDLGIPELDKALGGIQSGTNVVLVGPPMCGKDILVKQILHAGLRDGDGVILVSTGEPGESIFKWCEQHKLGIENYKNRFGIVDCVSKTLGMDVSDTQNIKRASSPVDLTGIGVKISQFFEQFYVKDKLSKARLAVDSLSTMLMYSNLQTVFRFLHVFTGRIKAADALGIYVLEAGMHDDKTVATLKKLFDGVIEIKEENGEFFIKTAGMGSTPGKWMKYEITGPKIVIKGD
ncbi:MAG: recombinase RecA [Methanosarcinales archaeon]|nr:MAG: recombinase RecA [Methanosarcinales archaeon]